MLQSTGSKACVLSACLMLLLSCAGFAFGQASGATPAPAGGAKMKVTHLMGLEGVKHNAKGTLGIDSADVAFQSPGGPYRISIASIEDVFTGTDSKQVGGTPMTLAKIAVPFGGGRAISLLAHQKFDSLTIQYRDANGGLHGAIFTLPLGQGSVTKKQLIDAGAHASTPVAEPSTKEKP